MRRVIFDMQNSPAAISVRSGKYVFGEIMEWTPGEETARQIDRIDSLRLWC